MSASIPKTRYARNGAARIAYQVIGDGPFDLVHVPGFVSNIEYLWEMPVVASVFRRLASFSRLIIWDKRGTGLSDPVAGVPPLEERMDDMLAVMDAAGSERAALFGVSEGGPLSLLASATYPERVTALALYGAAPRVAYAPDFPWGLPPELYGGAAREAILDSWGRDALFDVFAPSFVDDEAMRERWGTLLRKGASPAMGLATLEALMEIDVRGILASVTVPTLLIHRADDRAIPAQSSRFMSEQIPNARYVELPGCDHLWFVGDVDAIFDEVEQFLTGVRRGARVRDRMLATVMFTDIVDSTRKLTEVGDLRWRELLVEHEAIVRGELGRFRGREVKTVGDGFLATFDGPARAVACADAIRERSHDLGITIRAGVHTGECEVIDEDIAGVAVNIAARISAAAGADEVLVSRTVTDLVYGSGIPFEDRGLAKLKGLPDSWHLFAANPTGA
jgi:pimeloyl-ACP methyl ester carboxylesterase/class 3 adenylate cyclase